MKKKWTTNELNSLLKRVCDRLAEEQKNGKIGVGFASFSWDARPPEQRKKDRLATRIMIEEMQRSKS